MDETIERRREPGLTDSARQEQEARRARSAEALRDNLRRRKDQARQRAAGAPERAPGRETGR